MTPSQLPHFYLIAREESWPVLLKTMDRKRHALDALLWASKLNGFPDPDVREPPASWMPRTWAHLANAYEPSTMRRNLDIYRGAFDLALVMNLVPENPFEHVAALAPAQRKGRLSPSKTSTQHTIPTPRMSLLQLAQPTKCPTFRRRRRGGHVRGTARWQNASAATSRTEPSQRTLPPIVSERCAADP